MVPPFERKYELINIIPHKMVVLKRNFMFLNLITHFTLYILHCDASRRLFPLERIYFPHLCDDEKRGQGCRSGVRDRARVDRTVQAKENRQYDQERKQEKALARQ